MKQITQYIQEKLHISNYKKEDKYHYHPKDINELKNLIEDRIKKEGNNCNLNDIDVSNIKSFSFLFYQKKLKEFNGDISEWDMSNAECLEAMFYYSNFNGDISKWDVRKCNILAAMFERSKFDRKKDLENWDVNPNADMEGMFHASPLENNTPSWYHEKN